MFQLMKVPMVNKKNALKDLVLLLRLSHEQVSLPLYWQFEISPWLHCHVTLIGSLSNDDGDVNENGKKAVGLDLQNNNFARASSFIVHFFSVTARLRRENA